MKKKDSMTYWFVELPICATIGVAIAIAAYYTYYYGSQVLR